MKQKENNNFEASENNKKLDINSIGQILKINSDDIKTTMGRKKILLIIGGIMLLVLSLAGCMEPPNNGGHYMAISMNDFSWIWRWI